MRNKQGITIAALIIAIVGLSIGFAAFSNTLNISSSATVTPSDENFIVQFSKVSDADQTGSEYPIVPNSETYGDNAIINSSNKKLLEGVHAKFTAPGQSVTYELYVRNTGAYVAYLKELAFANATNATNGETYKHCYAATTDSNNQPISSENQATASLVSSACNGIDISVTIGTASNITPASASKSLGNQALSANGGNVQARVTISYDSNASYVDGPMEVEFGTISFTATSNQGSSQEQGGGAQVVDNSTSASCFKVNTVYNDPNASTYSVNEAYCMQAAVSSGQSQVQAESFCKGKTAKQFIELIENSGEEISDEVFLEVVDGYVSDGFITEVNNSGIDHLEINDFTCDGEVTDVVVPSTINGGTVTALNKGAFSGTSIESLIIPGTITDFDEECIYGNQSLTTLVFEEGITTINSGYAISSNSLTSVTLPSTITTIDNGAFSNNAITTLIIHKQQNSIDLTNTGLLEDNPTITWGTN